MDSGHTICPYSCKLLGNGLPKHPKFSAQDLHKAKKATVVGMCRLLAWFGKLSLFFLGYGSHDCLLLAEKEQETISVHYLAASPLDSSNADLHFLYLISV